MRLQGVRTVCDGTWAPSGTAAAIGEHWGSYLGTIPGEAGVTPLVCAHGPKLAGYPGAWLFRRLDQLVVSVPRRLLNLVESRLADAEEDPFAEAGCREIFGPRFETLCGPTWVGYLVNRADFTPARDTADVRPLGPTDARALLDLVESCGTGMAWEHGGVSPEQPALFGRFIGDELVAAAGYDVVAGARLANVTFATHPLHRGNGYGSAVASAAVGHALGCGLMVQWQTLRANTPSAATAAALGFRRYGERLVVRLRDGRD